MEGKTLDVYSPSGSGVRNIWTVSQGKVLSGQADRLVLYLEDSTVSFEATTTQFAESPNEVLVVRSGKAIPIFPQVLDVHHV